MDALAATNVLMDAAAQAADRKMLVNQYIQHHVLFHAPDVNPIAWNLPFIRVPALDVFRNDAVMLAVALVVIVGLFGFLYRKDEEVPRGWSNLLELFVVFIRDQIVRPAYTEEDARRFTPIFCAFFFLILTLNLLGLIPLFSAATSNISVTGALALVSGTFMVGLAIWRRGVLGFLKNFVPAGAPLIMMPMLVPIEIISFGTRIFALAIRLFANVLSGHILVFVLVSMVVLYGWFAIPAILLSVAIYFFEIFMSILQAFIFTMLTAIFVSQSIYGPH